MQLKAGRSSGSRMRQAGALAVISGLVVFVGPVAAAATPSDTFDDASRIEAPPFVDEGVDVSLATVDPEEPRPSCRSLRHTTWYELQPESDTALAVRAIPVDGTSFDIALDGVDGTYMVGPDFLRKCGPASTADTVTAV